MLGGCARAQNGGAVLLLSVLNWSRLADIQTEDLQRSMDRRNDRPPHIEHWSPADLLVQL